MRTPRKEKSLHDSARCKERGDRPLFTNSADTKNCCQKDSTMQVFMQAKTFEFSQLILIIEKVEKIKRHVA